MDERVKENEVIAYSVCQELELVSGAAASPDGVEAHRLDAACYAEYAKTIPLAERSRAGVPRGY